MQTFAGTFTFARRLHLRAQIRCIDVALADKRAFLRADRIIDQLDVKSGLNNFTRRYTQGVYLESAILHY